MYNDGKVKQTHKKAATGKFALQRMVSVFMVAMLTAAIPGMAVDAVGARPVQTEKSDSTLQPGNEAKQYIIAQDGTGDFTTIQEGVDHASDGDTLIICPGTYTEAVEVMNKEINITGVSRDLCILQYDTAFYRKVPLTMAVGTVSDLTIYGMNSGIEQSGPTQEEIDQINAELVGDSWDRQKNYTGYAVHIDQNYMYGRSIHFENCRIISENSHCVGVGSRGESSIRFDHCALVSLGGGSCIFMHDATAEEVSGATALVVKNSSLTSYLCPYVMTLQSLLPEYNTMYLTFQNVRVRAVAYEDSEGYLAENVNTGFDVETLAGLEKAGVLYRTGLSSTAGQLVHELAPQEAVAYMTKLSEAAERADYSEVLAMELPEGITYLRKSASDETSDPTKSREAVNRVQNREKHQVIAVYNEDHQAGNGWCGLDNAYLTQDSFGNTLVEMNAPLRLLY